MAGTLKQPKTILVRCPNWVGDLVMATPFFDSLKKNFPEARLIGLMRKRLGQVLRDSPWFDQIIEVNDKTSRGFIHTIRLIRSLSPDMGILLPNSIRSTLEMWLGGTRDIYGYRRGGRTPFLTGGPQPIREGWKIIPLPMVEYYSKICLSMGLGLPEDMKPLLFFSESVHNKCDRLLKKYGINPGDLVIGLNPGARFGSSKCWPPGHFAALAELFEETFHCKLLLLVGPGEDALAEAIVEQTHAHIANTAADKIESDQITPLIQRCQLLVTNDTGPRHYAVAFDVPVVVIMGPTDPRYTASNLEKTSVLRHDVDCSPCHKKVCPRDHVCMREITPAMVLEAGKQLMVDRITRV